jgi:hypothetical protein
VRHLLPRALLTLLLTFSATAADTQPAIYDLFTRLGSALSESNAIAFMQPFSSSMPDYQLLLTNVNALVEQSNVLSSISILEDQGSDVKRTITTDWFLEIVAKRDAGPVVRRRERVICSLERSGKKWKIVSLAPIQFFEPLKQF